jgi:hypothetical protein
MNLRRSAAGRDGDLIGATEDLRREKATQFLKWGQIPERRLLDTLRLRLRTLPWREPRLSRQVPA